MILSKNKNIQKIQFLPKTSISEKIDCVIFIIKKKKFNFTIKHQFEKKLNYLRYFYNTTKNWNYSLPSVF